jgi:hypothetical protein
MKIIKLVFVLILSFYMQNSLFAQIYEACPNVPNIVADNCVSSCIVCDLDGFTGRLINDASPLDSICGNSIYLENPQWVGFVAGSTAITFQIFSSFCTSTQGIQAAITKNCGTTMIACNAGSSNSANQSLVITATMLTIGKPYQLVIDGYNGAICSYQVTILGGSVYAPVTTLPDKVVCPEDLPFVWNEEPNTVINAPGTYNLTSSAYENQYACDSLVKQTITVMPYQNINYETYLLCPSACVTIDNHTYCEEGDYEIHYQTAAGCDSVRYIVFEKLIVEAVIQQPDTLTCLHRTVILNGNASTNATGCTYRWENSAGTIISTVKTAFVTEPGIYKLILGRPLNATTICYDTAAVNVISTQVYPTAAVAIPPPITCSNLQVQLMGSGSTGPQYSFEWETPIGGTIIAGANTFTPTINGQGVYRLIITDNTNGCETWASALVYGYIHPHTALATVSGVLGCTNPSVQLQGSSNAEQPVYSWSGPNGFSSNNQNPTVSFPGLYTLTVVNLYNDCVAVFNVNVLGSMLPPDVNVSSTPIICNQMGKITATSSIANATYNWSGPNGYTASNATNFVSVVGEYKVTVSGGNGCSVIKMVTVDDDSVFPTVITSSLPVNCTWPGEISAISSTNNALYTWSGPSGFTSYLATNVVSTIGTYNLTVTVPNTGCSTIKSIQVVDNTTPLQVSAIATSSLNCTANQVNLIANVTGGSDYLYEWTTPSGEIRNMDSDETILVNQAGTYTLHVLSQSTGCQGNSTVEVISYDFVGLSTTAVTGNACFGQSNGLIKVQGSGGDGNYNYSWSNGANTAQINNLSAGIYAVTVTDGEGCSDAGFVTISQPTKLNLSIAVTPQTIMDVANGTLTATVTGGTAPYTYIWSTGAPSANLTGLLPNTYFLTVKDANGCSESMATTVNAVNCVVSAFPTQSNVKCKGDNNGQAGVSIVNALMPVSYNWSNGSHDVALTNLSPGDYTMTLVDGANCPFILNYEITEPNQLHANAYGINANGETTNNGVGQCLPIGGLPPYSYNWSNGDKTALADSLALGNYSLTITDANNCSAVEEISIGSDNCGLDVVFLASSPVCNGNENGSIQTVLTGGNAPFAFNWNNISNTQNLEHIFSGFYNLEITDVNGCKVVKNYDLIEPAPLKIEILDVLNNDCLSSNTGQATVLAIGGTAPYQYQWSNGETGTQSVFLKVGNYTVNVSDINGCTALNSIEILAIDNEFPIIAANAISVPLDQEGNVELTLQNLNATITDNCLLQSTVIAPNTFNCSQKGVHQVTLTATDDASNTTTKTITVTIIDDILPIINLMPVDTLSVDASGVLYLSFSIFGAMIIDNCGVASAYVSPFTFNCTQLGPQNITLVAKDPSGNIATKSINIVVVDNIKPVLTCAPDVFRCSSESHTVTYIQPVASDNCSIGGGQFNFPQGLPSGSEFPTGTTTNTFTYSDNVGNVGSCSFNVTILTPIFVNLVNVMNDIGNQSLGSIAVEINGGLPPYTFTWKKNNITISTDQNPSNLPAGSYQLSILDAHGCTYTSELVSISNTSNIDEPTWANGLQIYPNPTSGRVVVKLENVGNKNNLVTVFDAQGRDLRRIELSSDVQNILDLHDLPSGMYILQLQVDGAQVVRRLVKN